ncbi:hypothetical protein HY990_03565 [Candidatus Micrarchaeota archaeon]|nr:hypothetical protein [Candidatus Micrarchaeota archaeon]
MENTPPPPSIEQIISKIYDERKGGKRNSDNTIIILTNKTNQLVLEMLELLRKQTIRDFDIIIIYGPTDEKIESTTDFNILHVMRKGDIGSSGGFYLGEKYALNEGYKLIIRTESDAMPQDRELIENLIKKTGESEVAIPISYNEMWDLRERGIHRYAAITAKTFERLGLTFYPFYFGADDTELERRLEKYAKRQEIENYVIHPIRSPITMNTFKYYYFTRNVLYTNCIHGNFLSQFLFVFLRIIHPYVFMRLSNDPGRIGIERAVKDFYDRKMWKIEIENLNWNYFEGGVEKVNPKIGIIKTNFPNSPVENIYEKMTELKNKPNELIYLKRDKQGVMNLLLEYIKISTKIASKDIIVNICPFYDLMYYGLLTRSVAFRDGKNWHHHKFSIIDRIKILITLGSTGLGLVAAFLFTLHMELGVKSKVKKIFKEIQAHSIIVKTNQEDSKIVS